MRPRTSAIVLLALFLRPTAFFAAEPEAKDMTAELGAKLDPFFATLAGKEARFHIRFAGEHLREKGAIEVSSFDGAFVLAVDHKEYPLRLERTADRTLLVVPGHKVAFEGTGAVSGPDNLDPQGITSRLIGQGTAAFPFLLVLSSASGKMAAAALTNLAGLKTEDGSTWTLAGVAGARIVFGAKSPSLEVTAGSTRVEVHKLEPPSSAPAAAVPEGFRKVAVDRTELERVLARGVRRALEVLAPSAALAAPPQEARNVPGGELRWKDGQRLIILKGTPREVGEAHGKLLPEEMRRCADSVTSLVGVVGTVRNGTWFLDDLRAAYKRLEPFLTEDWKAEVDGLADGAGVTRDEARLANIFPELFHCSGFALFGKATAGGKLYHGRVLDYMTEIGLQDAAGLFVVAVKGKIPFASVGYAGFIGSVSGMNARQISLGEMGGRGEGKWDGVPMATLMRRALEECQTLDEVKKLWSESKRTCEYYYVFADGKIPDAVGVGATPEKIEFIKPGDTHPLLGEGIPDAVVLSAGDRLKELQKRVKENHGKIDAEKAMWLMSRPVAMRSNLHNVLFVPQDLVLYVSHADRKEIAANRPYVKFDLAPLFKGAQD